MYLNALYTNKKSLSLNFVAKFLFLMTGAAAIRAASKLAEESTPAAATPSTSNSVG